MRSAAVPTADIVMLGSFSVWTLGTLQARALPLACALAASSGLRFALVTTPWDDRAQAGLHDISGGVAIYNTHAVRQRQAVRIVREQLHLLQQLQPKIIHVMKPKAAAGMTADLLARSGRGPRMIVDYDDWEGDGGWNDRAGYPILSRRLFAYQERRLLGVADAVTAASTLLEERARRMRAGTGAADVVLLPNGLERDWADELREAARANRVWNEPRLLLYTRFAEFTVEWLDEVLRRVDAALTTPVEIAIIGDGRERARGLVGMRRIRPIWHGFVPRASIPNLLGSATIALYPYDDNLINRSKQSVKLLELMASGCAIVATDVGDIRRVGGAAIRTAPAGDAAAFADAVVELCNDAQQAAERGRLAQVRAERFTIERLAQRLLPLYARLAGA